MTGGSSTGSEMLIAQIGSVSSTPALFVPMSEPNPVCIYKLRTSQVGSHFRLRGKEE